MIRTRTVSVHASVSRAFTSSRYFGLFSILLTESWDMASPVSKGLRTRGRTGGRSARIYGIHDGSSSNRHALQLRLHPIGTWPIWSLLSQLSRRRPVLGGIGALFCERGVDLGQAGDHRSRRSAP